MHSPTFLQRIRFRLPLLICALLLTVVGVFSWVAFERLERAFAAAGEERVTSASQRLATALAESARRLRGESRRLAADSAVRRYLRGRTGGGTRTAGAEADVRNLLERRLAASSQLLAVELRDARGQAVLAAGKPPASRVVDSSSRFADGDSPSRAGWVGPIATSGDTTYYEIVAPVVSRSGDTLGQLVQYRRLSSGQGAQLIGDLIGGDAAVHLGNVRGTVWTSLGGPAPPPGIEVTPGRAVSLPGERGNSRVGVATAIEDTPWVVLVSMPRHRIMAPARELGAAMIRLAALVLVAGALGAWLLSRQITGPLAEMTRAAEGIAGGDYARRAVVTRRDELGQLASVFNSMAAQVEDATHALEARVAERTHELEGALRELHDAQDELVRRERLAGEARYRHLVETAHEGVWTVDAEGRTDYVNPRMAAMLGYRPEEMIGRALYDFMDHEARAEAEQNMERRRQGIEEVHEFRLRRRDGAEVLTLMSTSPIRGKSGEFAGALALVTDMTERKGLEEQLRQSQRLEAIGQLAGGVAHDFNNLLTVIKSYSQLLLEQLGPGGTAAEDLLEIEKAANRAAALTSQLLAFSRKQVLQPRVLDLNAVVSDTEKMLRRLIGEDVELRLRLGAQLPPVYADPGQVEQVLMNLAVNARDAMPAGGRLAIETAAVELSGQSAGRHIGVAAGRYVMLAVSDTGHGMTRETLSQIFEPFFTTKPQGKGTGLGLSTVYGIVKQSGGDIWVYSEPGQGTTLKIYLPRHEGEAEPAAAPEHASVEPARPTETILLVEDEDALRALARRVLEGKGYTVLPAGDGREALAIAERHAGPIDLLLTDVVMPGMSGRALAERMATIRPAIQTLYMSGYTDDDVVRRGVIAPDTLFLQKPFTPDSLAASVRRALETRGVKAPAASDYAAPAAKAPKGGGSGSATG